ncbi:unnamed protein product [Pleuronectes platessa]|uniref:Uncharacterized protein n=1 Tax=Pleuronectes platessa TaxID=8262 RepID=A0A9N7VPD9_PLEPL|nr:unnamed protein product [Pleuronectes platessa]
MIDDENETYPADVGNPEPVCEVSGTIASLAVSRPGTARIQPATEQPAATAAGRQAGTDCYEANATWLTSIGPPEASRRHGSSSPTSPNEPELRRELWHVTYPDRRLCFSARSLLLPESSRSELLTWSQHPDDITQRARAEEGAWARDLPRPQALLLGQISASHSAHRLISASRGGGYAM